MPITFNAKAESTVVATTSTSSITVPSGLKNGVCVCFGFAADDNLDPGATPTMTFDGNNMTLAYTRLGSTNYNRIYVGIYALGNNYAAGAKDVVLTVASNVFCYNISAIFENVAQTNIYKTPAGITDDYNLTAVASNVGNMLLSMCQGWAAGGVGTLSTATETLLHEAGGSDGWGNVDFAASYRLSNAASETSDWTGLTTEGLVENHVSLTLNPIQQGGNPAPISPYFML